MVADAFGLVNVCPDKLLKAEAEKNPPVKIKIQQARENGEPIPDEIMLKLIEERIDNLTAVSTDGSLTVSPKLSLKSISSAP